MTTIKPGDTVWYASPDGVIKATVGTVYATRLTLHDVNEVVRFSDVATTAAGAVALIDEKIAFWQSEKLRVAGDGAQ